MLKDYPTDGVDAKAAAALQERFDRGLLYYVDTGDPKELARLIKRHTWVVAPAAVTATLRVWSSWPA